VVERVSIGVMSNLIERVADRFVLGRPVGAPVAVNGGLSNEMWRLATDQGEFALKHMVANAGEPEFVGNIEAAFGIEQRAWSAGVPMTEPVPDPVTGGALAFVDDSFFRVHRWVDGEVGVGPAAEAVALLARIHAVGLVRWSTLAKVGWRAEGWGADLVELAQRVSGGSPDRVLVVDSHCDLDRKNTIRSLDGRLLAVDWVSREPTDVEGFGAAVNEYTRRTGIAVPAKPWIFAGWVAAYGGWLDYNAKHRAGTASGAAEVAETSARLRRLAAEMNVLLGQMAR